MGFVLIAVLLFAAADRCGADDAPKASRIVDDAALSFDPKGVAAGVKATLALLASCRSEAWPRPNPPTGDDVRAVLRGDYVRVVFAQPVTAVVLSERVEFSELVVGAEAVWLRSGDTVARYAKFDHEEHQRFQAWHRQAPPAK